MTVLDKINRQNRAVMFGKVEKFLGNDYLKHIKGFKTAEGFLIFEIGNNQSVHINPGMQIVKLVDERTWGDKKLDSVSNIAILNRFFCLAEEKIESFLKDQQSDMAGRLALLTNLISLSLNTQDLYFKSEIWYFKSLFSGHLTTFCFNTSGEYAFALSDGNILHVYISEMYLNDEGFYFIEDRSKTVSKYRYEPDCTVELLVYLKELCKNPKKLQNLAKN